MNSSERAVIRKLLTDYETNVIGPERLTSGIRDVVEMDNWIIEPMLVGPNLHLNLWIRDLKTLDRKDLVAVRDELDNQLEYASHELGRRETDG